MPQPQSFDEVSARIDVAAARLVASIESGDSDKLVYGPQDHPALLGLRRREHRIGASEGAALASDGQFTPAAYCWARSSVLISAAPRTMTDRRDGHGRACVPRARSVARVARA
jgi:hypothetical protein